MIGKLAGPESKQKTWHRQLKKRAEHFQERVEITARGDNKASLTKATSCRWRAGQGMATVEEYGTPAWWRVPEGFHPPLEFVKEPETKKGERFNVENPRTGAKLILVKNERWEIGLDGWIFTPLQSFSGEYIHNLVKANPSLPEPVKNELAGLMVEATSQPGTPPSSRPPKPGGPSSGGC